MPVPAVAFLLVAMGMAITGFGGNAYAAYGSVTTDSDVDPTVVRIDEKANLGKKINYDFILQEADGNEFAMGDLFGKGKPVILALSYYTCDGACSVLNRNLRYTLQGVDDWTLGKDYDVLTVSFDQHDTPATLKAFMKKAGFADGLPDGWRMTTMKSKEDILKLTQSIGFKFFWSPRDAMFLHPNVYIMLSPEGRVTRFLYGGSIGPDDMELSITKAIGEEISPANVINFVLGACYSYNYKDGKYTINIPLFIAGGALIFGIGLIVFSFSIMRRRRVKHENQIIAA